ncbi:MAG: hypothetical protein OEO77_05485 [Acidimicrobiia bacterium]|nr:hypothetical protein [Acidimicrobiia bacterium]
MVLEFFRGGEDQLESLHGDVQDMLASCRHTFNAAINTVLGGTDPQAVGKDIRKTDRTINKAERKIRRALVVHASTRGAQADIGTILVLMSITKDIERVGDYAKNIWDLADHGVDMSNDDDVESLRKRRDQVTELIVETSRIFASQDTEAAHVTIQAADELLDEFDAEIGTLIGTDAPGSYAVPRALLSRYLKRIVAHLMNVMSAVVMPVDRLDYYDEDKADRI